LLDSDNNLKPSFREIFSAKNIFYDIEDDKFYDYSKRMTKKLLYLIPEKYFREETADKIDLEQFKSENDTLILNIKSELSELLGDL